MNLLESEDTCRILLAKVLKVGEAECLTLEHNDHKTSYHTAKEEMLRYYSDEDIEALPRDIYDNMCSSDSMWCLRLRKPGKLKSKLCMASSLSELLTVKGVQKLSSELEVDSQVLEDFRWILESTYVTFSIDANTHLWCGDTVMTMEEYFPSCVDEFHAVSEVHKQEMLDANTLWSFHVYPNTPIGFYQIHRSTLKDVLRDARELLEEISANTHHPWKQKTT